jgi:hypothetical protein
MLDLLLAAAAAALIGAAAVAVLHWRRIEREIQARKIEDGFAQVFDDGLRNGYHEVHIDVFDRSGSRQTSRVIKARELDDETERRLRESGGTIRVYT